MNFFSHYWLNLLSLYLDFSNENRVLKSPMVLMFLSLFPPSPSSQLILNREIAQTYLENAHCTYIVCNGPIHLIFCLAKFQTHNISSSTFSLPERQVLSLISNPASLANFIASIYDSCIRWIGPNMLRDCKSLQLCALQNSKCGMQLSLLWC